MFKLLENADDDEDDEDVEDVDEADDEAECEDDSAFGEDNPLLPGGGGRNKDGENLDAAAAWNTAAAAACCW